MESTIREQNAGAEKEVTMSAGQANLYALIFLLPLLLFLALPYYFIWPEQFSKSSIRYYLDAKEMMAFADMGLILLVIVAGVIAHELLHGLGWSFYTKNGWKSIKFGIMWSFLTPYCHCKEPLQIRHYRIGTILPAILLGIIPSVIAITGGHIVLMAFGFFFTFSAGGDFLILWLIRKESGATLVQDHPDKIGCVIYEN